MSKDNASAAQMLHMVNSSVLFILPERPRLVPGLAAVPHEELLVVDGGRAQFTFRGGAIGLLHRLWPLLDGTRTGAGLAAGTGAGAEHVHQILALLYSRGLLTDAAGDLAAPTPAQRLIEPAVARLLDTTRAHTGTGPLLTSLTAGPVRVVVALETAAATEEAAVELVRLLEECAIPASVGTPDGADGADRAALVVAVADDPDSELFERVAAASGVSGVPWLRVLRRPASLELGPLFGGEKDVCHHCFHAGLRDRPWDADPAPADGRDPADPRPEHGPSAGLGLVATDVFHYLARVGTSWARTGTAARFRLDDWSVQERPALRRVGCARCCPGAPGASGPLPLAFAYDQQSFVSTPEENDPKAFQAHYRAENMQLATVVKDYESAVPVELPQVGPEQLDAPDGTPGRTPLRDLALMLKTGFGASHVLREPDGTAQLVRRLTATGGNLGSPQAYVLVREVPGLPCGLYYYHPLRHQLLPLRTGTRAEVEEWAAECGVHGAEGTDGWTTAFFIASAFPRVASKYGTFALRVCLLDAGVALEQLGHTARQLGLTTSVREHWDDRAVLGLLRLTDAMEPVGGVLTMGAR